MTCKIMCVIIGGGIGGRIIVNATVAGVSLLLNYDEEKSLAAVNVKGQSELVLLQKVEDDDGRSLCECHNG